MAEERTERRLTTILAADIVGYSRLMAADEAGTLASLKAIRRELFEPKTTEHHGRVVKLIGDGTLMEFGSVVDAVNFSVEVQRAMADRNTNVPEDRRISYRIGINIGDIMVEGEDIYGDGVNVAARLEALAEPGGICVSRPVHTQVKGKVDLAFEDLGNQQVKNIPEPVQVFRVSLDTPTAERSAMAPAATKRSLSWPLVAGGLSLLVILAGIALWQRPWEAREVPASEANMAFPLPARPSIAVLPFNNMSDDASQEYFADGMTEDIITDLSKISGLFVIARNSSFSYKGQQVKVRQVAEELGVRYVLEGSVRRAGDEVRVNAQLIDATTGGHLWAERYDGTLNDIFDLQDQVTGQIVTALALELTPEEKAEQTKHATENAEAHDAYLQGWARYKLLTPEDLSEALPFFEEALRLDPNYAEAHAALASLFWDVLENDWAFDLGMASFDVEESANKHLEEALKNPTPLAHAVQAKMLASLGFYEDAVQEAEKAVALDENDATALAGLADALIQANRPGEALAHIDNAMRFDPHHPPSYLIILGAAQFGITEYERAAQTFERAIKRNPNNEVPYIYLASAYGHLGMLEEADDTIERANDVRNLVGLGELSLRETTAYNTDRFDAEIEFAQFGSREVRELVRVGLVDIAALKWQYLITVHVVLGPGNSWYEVEGATFIDAPTAKLLHEKGVTFIDTSSESVWKSGHIPGAINLPSKRTNDANQVRYRKTTLQEVANVDEEIVIYEAFPSEVTYATGAWEAAKAVTWGYRNVYVLDRATWAWRAADYPLETD